MACIRKAWLWLASRLVLCSYHCHNSSVVSLRLKVKWGVGERLVSKDWNFDLRPTLQSIFLFLQQLFVRGIFTLWLTSFCFKNIGQQEWLHTNLSQIFVNRGPILRNACELVTVNTQYNCIFQLTVELASNYVRYVSSHNIISKYWQDCNYKEVGIFYKWSNILYIVSLSVNLSFGLWSIITKITSKMRTLWHFY